MNMTVSIKTVIIIDWKKNKALWCERVHMVAVAEICTVTYRINRKYMIATHSKTMS